MENPEAVLALGGVITTLAGALVKVTTMLLKEKDSKINMLREFYEMTSGGIDETEE